MKKEQNEGAFVRSEEEWIGSFLSLKKISADKICLDKRGGVVKGGKKINKKKLFSWGWLFN